MASLTYSRRAIEWILAGLAAAGGLGALLAGRNYGFSAPTGVGSGVVPAVAGGLLLLGAIAWSIELLRARVVEERPDAIEALAQTMLGDEELDVEVHEEEDQPLPDRSGWARVLTVLAAMAAAAALLQVLGFTVTMLGLLLVLLVGVNGRRVRTSLVIGVLVVIAARLIFENWLGTVLPSSSISFLAALGL